MSLPPNFNPNAAKLGQLAGNFLQSNRVNEKNLLDFGDLIVLDRLFIDREEKTTKQIATTDRWERITYSYFWSLIGNTVTQGIYESKQHPQHADQIFTNVAQEAQREILDPITTQFYRLDELRATLARGTDLNYYIGLFNQEYQYHQQLYTTAIKALRDMCKMFEPYINAQAYKVYLDQLEAQWV